MTLVDVSHRIRVLGKELQVKSSASPESVREIEAFVNGKAAEVAAVVKGGDTQVVAILTLLNIAEAYLTEVRKHEAIRELEEERMPGLIRRIQERLGS